MLWRETATASASCCCVQPFASRSSRTRFDTPAMTSGLYVRFRTDVKSALPTPAPSKRRAPVRRSGLPPPLRHDVGPGEEQVLEAVDEEDDREEHVRAAGVGRGAEVLARSADREIVAGVARKATRSESGAELVAVLRRIERLQPE